MGTVYLAGPISGCTFGECTDWREEMKARLLPKGITCWSPMRAKGYLAKLATISATGQEYVSMSPLSTPRGVITRDRFDTQRVDVVLMNLLGATKVSIGSMIEMGWADSVRTPIIVVMESEGNPHEHMMVSELTGFRVTTVEEAEDICLAILGPLGV
jgi:hypothetical protein